MEPISVTTSLDMAAAEDAVRVALAEQGFGILTEIDMAVTLKNKIDVDRAPLKLLGACNPHLANKALNVDPNSALVLPCTVVLAGSESGTTISTVNPRDIIPSEGLGGFADDVANKLRVAFEAVAS